MRLLKVCFALGCLVCCSRWSFAGEPQWVEVRSPNFSVITDAGDKRGRDVALHFEQMRSVFGTLMTKATVNMSVDNPWSVVFHEYAHQLMNGNLSVRTDPWFEEGFAEYFSSIEVDNKEARVGKIPEDTYRILQQNGMMRIAELFRVQQYSKTYNESGDHRSVFYAESSLLVHYLYD